MAFYTTPTLETERLILRPPTLADAPDVQRQFGHFEIIRYIGPVPWPYPDDGAHQFYSKDLLPKMERGEMIGWVITRKNNGELLGALDMRPDGKVSQQGFWLGLPFHRHGIISEALAATTDYAFEVIGMPSIHTENAQENVASSRTQAKTGAELVGVNQSKYLGEPKPQEQWLLTPERWRDSPMKRMAAAPSYRIII